jgi:hypothetical protein
MIASLLRSEVDERDEKRPGLLSNEGEGFSGREELFWKGNEDGSQRDSYSEATKGYREMILSLSIDSDHQASNGRRQKRGHSEEGKKKPAQSNDWRQRRPGVLEK